MSQKGQCNYNGGVLCFQCPESSGTNGDACTDANSEVGKLHEMTTYKYYRSVAAALQS